MSPKLVAMAWFRLSSSIIPTQLASPIARVGRPHRSASIATRPAPITKSD
ncbi:Uncharacterised protein [Vibrio cholerae]|nr:Uncharacterised protein [Vibrio cholerae]